MGTKYSLYNDKLRQMSAWTRNKYKIVPDAL